jgi:hypothetical protein
VKWLTPADANRAGIAAIILDKDGSMVKNQVASLPPANATPLETVISAKQKPKSSSACRDCRWESTPRVEKSL